MKKRFISITKAIVCALAMTTIFSCANQGSSTVVSGGSSASVDGIAYVYIDSLINGYDLYNDEATKLMAKQNQYEQELQSKGKSLERRAMELQQNYEKRLVTPTRAQEIQNQLANEQQKLMQTRDQQAMELADDQAQMMNRVGDSIRNFINEFNADKRFKLIISTQGNSVLLYADPALDITKVVLDGLNKRYRGTSGGATPAPAAKADTTASK